MFEIGDLIRGRVSECLDERRFRIECPEVEAPWQAILKLRRGFDNRSWKVGDAEDFRLIRVAPKRQEVLLGDQDDEFGFLPISDKMRPEYRKGIRLTVAVLGRSPVGRLTDDDLDDWARAQGIFGRCLDQNSSDWFTLYDGLGRPAYSDLRRIHNHFRELRAATKDEQQQSAERARAALERFGTREMLRRLETYIRETEPGFQKTPRSAPGRKEKSEGPRAETIVQYERRRLEQANPEHQRALDILSRHVGGLGCEPDTDTFPIDCFTRLKSGPAIFEVKSITSENEQDQTRAAIAQLFEYRFRHNYPDASLWVVYSAAPKIEWVVDFLDYLGIRVLWCHEGEIVGHSVQALEQKKS